MSRKASFVAILVSATCAMSGTPTLAQSTTANSSAGPVAPATQPSTGAPAATATPPPIVGGAAMLATKTVVENASASRDHTTFMEAIRAAGLVGTLSGSGPFTVFAPTNDAFTRLAPGTMSTLMKPANKASLIKMLTYHLLPGRVTIDDLRAKVQAGGGKATLATVQGQMISVTTVGGTGIKLTDGSGNVSYVTQGDVAQSNGLIHVVNGVLIPKLS